MELELHPDPGGNFASDQHRHIAGHLLQPRTIWLLQRELLSDPAVNMPEAGVLDILGELEDDGLVVRFGDQYSEAQDLVDEINGDAQAITLPEEQAEIYVNRVHSRPDRQAMYLGTGEQWILAEAGLDLLNAEVQE